MRRERVLQIVLVVVGLLFCALLYPLAVFFSREPAMAMMLGLYVTLGFFSCWQRGIHRNIAA